VIAVTWAEVEPGDVVWIKGQKHIVTRMAPVDTAAGTRKFLLQGFDKAFERPADELVQVRDPAQRAIDLFMTTFPGSTVVDRS